jgi:hypothetical protein
MSPSVVRFEGAGRPSLPEGGGGDDGGEAERGGADGSLLENLTAGKTAAGNHDPQKNAAVLAILSPHHPAAPCKTRPPARRYLAMSAPWNVLAVLLSALPALGAAAEDGVVFFENEVRPLLVKHCYECHSQDAGKQKGGLLLDRREGWQLGGDAGPALIPGDAEKSLLMHSLRYLDEDLQMPPDSKLSETEIAVFEKWIAIGAPDPRDATLAETVRKTVIDFNSARQNWAFKSHLKSKVPTVKDTPWPRTELDSFILAGLEKAGHQPAADASPAALMRRLYYDLTGLPPVGETLEMSQIEPLVDRLLASPAFGEKFGRHWLDLVRYADSNGGDRNYTFYQAWRYRNYVIDSFNRRQTLL